MKLNNESSKKTIRSFSRAPLQSSPAVCRRAAASSGAAFYEASVFFGAFCFFSLHAAPQMQLMSHETSSENNKSTSVCCLRLKRSLRGSFKSHCCLQHQTAAPPRAAHLRCSYTSEAPPPKLHFRAAAASDRPAAADSSSCCCLPIGPLWCLISRLWRSSSPPAALICCC